MITYYARHYTTFLLTNTIDISQFVEICYNMFYLIFMIWRSAMTAGVYTTCKTNGTEYYRVSITFHSKHISLGSFSDLSTASDVYTEACAILSDCHTYSVNTDLLSSSYSKCHSKIPFDKFITLLNFRDNSIYIKTPIYLCRKYFLYFLSTNTVLKFDADDLFYFSNHKIMARGSYYFVNDYGMQTSIMSRYGIRSHSVPGRDYLFKNGDEHDLRYSNIHVVNHLFGVSRIEKNGRILFKSKIHINGDFIIGTYNSESEAAIAYNKAVDLIGSSAGISYNKNYLEDISSIEYAVIYNSVGISKKLRNYILHLKESNTISKTQKDCNT